MIIQGSNEPITVTFDIIPADVSITLHNEIQTFKQWNTEELYVSDDGLTYTAPIDQLESYSWEEGPCEIQVRWMDSTGDMAGIVQTAILRDSIIYSRDQEILEAGE